MREDRRRNQSGEHTKDAHPVMNQHVKNVEVGMTIGITGQKRGETQLCNFFQKVSVMLKHLNNHSKSNTVKQEDNQKQHVCEHNTWNCQNWTALQGFLHPQCASAGRKEALKLKKKK